MISSLKSRISVFISSIAILCMPVLVLAQSSSDTTKKTFTLSNPLKVESVAGLVQSFVEIFSYVVIIIAVLALIWVGFQYIISRGDVKKMTDLKNWLFWIVIGVAVVIGARVIIEIIINTLAATNIVDQGTLNSVRGSIPR